MVMQAAINLFGSVAVAAFTAASKVQNLVTQGMMSMGQTMASYGGQNYGKGDYHRLEKGVRSALLISVIYSLLAAVAVGLFLRPLLSLFFSGDIDMASLMPWAKTYIYMCAVFYIPLSTIFIFRNIMQGCGYSFLPMMGGVVELFARMITALIAMKLVSFPLACFCDPAAWVGAALVHLSRTQGWQPAERTLGIVGVGHVGSLVKAYAEGWGFRVVCCDPPREERERCGFRTLEEVAREADILTFHTPLDASTRHMADSRLFGLMKPGAILINSSRGEVVDGEALLRSGLGWALDVWEHEPHLDPALLENALLATPHIAGYSEQGKANATAMSVASLARRFGLPLEGWYPPQAAPARRRPISWQELCRTIGGAYDIASESRSLKERPGDFESMRDHYAYRREYF